MPVELQPVALDLVPRGSGKLAHEVAHGTIIEVLHLPATRAHEMVMVLRPLRQAVMKAAVVQKHPAHDAQFCEEPNRPKYRRPAGPSAAVQQVVHREMAGLLEHGGNNGAPRRRNAIAASLEL